MFFAVMRVILETLAGAAILFLLPYLIILIAVASGIQY